MRHYTIGNIRTHYFFNHLTTIDVSHLIMIMLKEKIDNESNLIQALNKQTT